MKKLLPVLVVMVVALGLSCAYAINSFQFSATIVPSSAAIACDIGPAYIGAIPAAATQAGFTHCAANYDFTQTESFTDSRGTHQWSNLSTWFSCANSADSTNLLYYNGGFSAPPVPCDTAHQNVTTDGGTQVFALSYGSADASAGNADNFVKTTGGNSPAVNIPSAHYIEYTIRLTSVNTCSGNGCIVFDLSTYWSGSNFECFLSTDGEIDSGVTQWGTGFALWNAVCGTPSGTGGGPAGPPANMPVNTSYNTYGRLVTADNVSQFSLCDYYGAGAVAGLPSGSFKGCSPAATVVPPSSNTIFHTQPLYIYISEGPQFTGTGFGSGNWTATSHTTYIQRMTVWACPGYNTGACFTNPVITTHP